MPVPPPNFACPVYKTTLYLPPTLPGLFTAWGYPYESFMIYIVSHDLPPQLSLWPVSIYKTTLPYTNFLNHDGMLVYAIFSLWVPGVSHDLFLPCMNLGYLPSPWASPNFFFLKAVWILTVICPHHVPTSDETLWWNLIRWNMLYLKRYIPHLSMTPVWFQLVSL